MNLQSIFTTVAATLLAAASLNTRAQDWQMILPSPDIAPGWSGSSALIDPLSVDPSSPGVFIGCWSDSPEGIGSVLHLDPNGNPSVVDTDLDRVYGLGCIPSSQTPTLYAVGEGKLVTVPPFPRNNPNVWKVRKSITGGGANSWATDDTFYLSTKPSAASARGITTDAGGNVYVCGLANSHWIVRRLPSGGSWATVSDVSSQGEAIANGMCFFPGNSYNSTKAVLAVGILNSKWTVLRSQNQGASWQSVDAWSPGSKAAATAAAATCDSAGNIFVVGYRGTWVGPTGWVIRMSSDGGNTWIPVLDISEGAHSWALAVAADGVGNIWVSGMTFNTSGVPRWTVLQHSPSESWPQSWSFRGIPFGQTYSKARGIATATASDASGNVVNNVFVTGELGWQDGTSRVAVQRLLP
jgi:hypothetical protein